MKPYEQHMQRKRRGMPVAAEILLDMVATCGEHAPTIVQLKRAAEVDGVCSFPNAHEKLHWLITNSYVKAATDLQDVRKKRLFVTAKGRKYLKEVK